MRPAGIAVLLLAAGALPAEPESWMKKARPNELGLSTEVSPACPGDLDRYERAVLAEFGRAWIAPLDVVPGEVFLRVEIWCYQGRTLDPFTVHVEYAVLMDAYGRRRSLSAGYDAHGAGPMSAILTSTERIVRAALRDHVAANFDH